MEKIKLGILGCGRISHKHLKAIIELSDQIELVAVFDIVESLANSLKEEYELSVEGAKVVAYSNYSDFIENNNIDAVTIASISGLHVKHAIDCLNNGKHVIIEKPMALTVEDAEEIIRVGKENNKKISVSHQNRFLPVNQQIKAAIDQGKFGKIISGSARTLWARDDEYYRQASWRGTKDLDGGTLMNQCIHNIDLLQWLLGDVVKVSAELDTFIRDIETEDFGAILLRFATGTIGIIEGSVCVYPRNLEESISIFGENGTVVVKNGKVETWTFKDRFELPDIDEEQLGHLPLYEDFIRAVREDRKPEISGEEGIKAIELIEKAYHFR